MEKMGNVSTKELALLLIAAGLEVTINWKKYI